jgi:hypothetical protein
MPSRKPRAVPAGILSNLSRNPPTLIDALIIIFISAALLLFIFWLATVLGNFPVLQTLPDFIGGAFKSIWTSATSATAGIGLAIYRALTSNSKERPHYIGWILITSAVLVAIVYVLAQWLYGRDFKTIELPSDLRLLSADVKLRRPLAAPVQPFYLISYPVFGVRYSLEGTYSINGDTISGKVMQGQSELNPNTAPMDPGAARLASISVNLCYVQTVGNSEGVQIRPSPNNTNNSIGMDVQLIPGTVKKIPVFNFHINLPKGVVSDRMWLCSQLFNKFGGSFPSYQTDKFVNSGLVANPVPPMSNDWRSTSPIAGTSASLPCPCVSVRYGEPPKAPQVKLGEDAFIDVKNDCVGPVTAVAFKFLAPNIQQSDMFKDNMSTQYAKTTLKPDESVRYSLAGAYGGGGLITQCDK